MKRRKGTLGSIIQDQLHSGVRSYDGRTFSVADGDVREQAHTTLQDADTSVIGAYSPGSIVRPGPPIPGGGSGGSSSGSSGGGGGGEAPPGGEPAPRVPPPSDDGGAPPPQGGEDLPPGFFPPESDGNGGDSSALDPETGVYDDTAPWLKQLKQWGREFIDPRGQIGPLPTWGWWLIIAGSAGALWYWRAS